MAELPDEGDTSSQEDEAIFAKIYGQSASIGNLNDAETLENPPTTNNATADNDDDSEGNSSSPEFRALYAKLYEEDEVPLNDHSHKPPSIRKLKATEEMTSNSSLIEAEAIFAKMYEQESSARSLNKKSQPLHKRAMGAPSEYDTDSSLQDEAIFAKMYEQKSSESPGAKLQPPFNINKRIGAPSEYDTDSSLQDEAIFAKMYEQKSSDASLSGSKRSVVPETIDEDTDSSLQDAAIFAKMYQQKSSEGSSLNEDSEAPVPPTGGVRRQRPSVEDEAMFAALYGEKSNSEESKPSSNEFAGIDMVPSYDEGTESSERDEALFAKMFGQQSSDITHGKKKNRKPTGNNRSSQDMFEELYGDTSSEIKFRPKSSVGIDMAGNIGIDMVPSQIEDMDSSFQDDQPIKPSSEAIFKNLYGQKMNQISPKSNKDINASSKSSGISPGKISDRQSNGNKRSSQAMFEELYGKKSNEMKPPMESNMESEMEDATDSSLQDEALFAKIFEQKKASQTSLQEDSDSSLIGPTTGRRAADVKSALSIPKRLPFAPLNDDESNSSFLPSERLHPEPVEPLRPPNAVPAKSSKNKFKTGGFTFGALSPSFKKKKTIKQSKFPNVKRSAHNNEENGARPRNNNVRQMPARPIPQRGLVHQESELPVGLLSPRQKNRRGNRRGSLLGALGGLVHHKDKKDTDLPPTEEELEMMKEYEMKHGLRSQQHSSERQSSPPQTRRKQSNRRGSMFGGMPQKHSHRAPPPPSPGRRHRKQSNRRGSMFGAVAQKQQAPAAPFASPVRKGRSRRLSMFGNMPQSANSNTPPPPPAYPPIVRHDSNRELQASPLASSPRQKRGRNRRGSVFGALGGNKEKKDHDLPPTEEELAMMKEYEMKHGTNNLDNANMEFMSPPQTMRNRGGVRRGSITTGLMQVLSTPKGLPKRKIQRDASESSLSAKSLMSPYSSPRRKPLARRGSIQAGLPGGPPLPGQLDRRPVMPGMLQRIDSVGSIDISLSSESVESGEMFAVPKKYDDELGDIESSYRGISEFRGGSMDRRHAAVGLNMQLFDDEEEDDPAVVGHRNTMLKRGRQKALLSIEDLAKNDDELFDFLNAMAKEDGEMQWMKQTLEGNIYSLVYTAKWRSAAFWGALVVGTFQVAMPGLAILDLIDFQNPSNPFQAPNNVSLQVRTMGIMALLLSFAQFWIFMAAVEKLLKGPPPRWEDTPPGATKKKFYLAYVLQGLMGSMFILTIFTLVAQSTNVVSMFLNFAALEFITGVDRVLFELAKRGYFTNKIKQACDDVTNVLVVRRKGGRTVRRIVLAVAAATVTVLYFQIAIRQQTGAFDCGSLEVQFGDGFNSVLPLFSGIYKYDSNYRDGRPVYWDERKRAAFRYCGNSDGGIFSFEEGGHYVFNYISEDSGISSIDDMCNNYIVRSPDTKGFNILHEPTNTWMTKRRLTDSIQYSVEYFSLRCADCDPSTCNGECQEGVCKCLAGQYGPNCQFSDAPCENIDIDRRTKRFRKAGSLYSSEFSILRKSDDLPALSYGRPIYTDSWAERGLKDGLVLMNFGRRYFLFRMAFFNEIKATALGDYLHKVHPYFDWLQYQYVLNATMLTSNVLQDGPSDALMVFRPDFGSDPIDFGTSYDSISPLDLSWSRVGTSILSRTTYYEYLKRTSAVDTVMICSKCSDSSPCFGNSKCNEQGTCECGFTLAGRLCEVDCFDEPENEVCSSCFRDPSGEGCLQCHRDLNAPDCPWAYGLVPNDDNTNTGDGNTDSTLTNTTASNSTADDMQTEMDGPDTDL